MRMNIGIIPDDELLDYYEKASRAYDNCREAVKRNPGNMELVSLASDTYKIAESVAAEVARRLQSETQDFVDGLA
jgi:hypothetical protein